MNYSFFNSFMFYVILRMNLYLNNIHEKITFDNKMFQMSIQKKIENEYYRKILMLLINLTMVSSILDSLNKLNLIFE